MVGDNLKVYSTIEEDSCCNGYVRVLIWTEYYGRNGNGRKVCSTHYLKAENAKSEAAKLVHAAQTSAGLLDTMIELELL